MTSLIHISALPFSMALGASLIGMTNASPDAEGVGIQITAGFVVTMAVTACGHIENAQVPIRKGERPYVRCHGNQFAVSGYSYDMPSTLDELRQQYWIRPPSLGGRASYEYPNRKEQARWLSSR
jgi:hypothetical protein